MSTIPKQQQSITVSSSITIATVAAYPDEVVVKVSASDGVLTIAQARELGRQIFDAAHLAERLEFTGDEFRDSDLVLRDVPTSPDSAQPEHRCLDPRAGTLRLDDRGRCFWCGDQVVPTSPDSGSDQ